MTIEEREGLPEGWAVAELEKLGKWGSGGTPQRTNPAFYTESGIPWLVIGDLNDSLVYKSRNHITELGLRNSASTLLNPGTLLIAMYGSIGKMGITAIQCATNQAIAYCVPNIDLVHLKFLFFSLKNEQDALISQGQGGAQQNISQTILKAHQIPLPPLAEQIRIADKLDALLSRVDAGRERLERVPKLVKRFRQSVLSAAVSGELTREWRENSGMADGPAQQYDLLKKMHSERREIWEVTGKGRYSEPEAPDSHELPDLPANWTIASLSSFSEKIGDVDHKMPKAQAEGIPYISTKDFLDNETINFTDAKKISEDEYDELARKIAPQRGDLLISRYGTIGKTRIADFNDKFQASYSIAIVKLVSKRHNRFLKIVLDSEYGQLQMKRNSRASAQPDLGLAHIRTLCIPLPSLPEQAEIVRRVESLFAIADRLEARAQAALARYSRLTPALLAKAFRGELVPQDPTDEPASVLLERIRAQREAAGPVKKAGGRGRRPGVTTPKAEAGAEAEEAQSEPKRGRGRPRKVQEEAGQTSRGIPVAASAEEAIRLLQERARAEREGRETVQAGLFGN